MTIDIQRIRDVLEVASKDGRASLLEHEVYAVLAAAGCRAPRFLLLTPGLVPTPAALSPLGERVVLKIVSPEIAHKTDVGGVATCANDPAAVSAAADAMLEEVPRRYAKANGHPPSIRGVMAVERLAVEGHGPGSEAIVALRHNREFGPVITFGVGGIDTELLGEACRKGVAVMSASAAMLDAKALLAAVSPTLAYRRLAGQTREAARLVEDAAIERVLEAFRAVGEAFGHDGPGDGWTITELEVNPFAASRGELVALDGLLKFRRRSSLPAPRPLASLENTLRPQSMAIMGVSSKGMNMGRIILGNILEAGFDRSRSYVIRADCEEIDGVRCVPSVKDLPERVDLFIVAVSAEQVPHLMEELVEHDKAVGVILIPGGMAEKAGGEALEARLKASLKRARELKRPLVANGGNCLGILSRPGRYHTLFIPKAKLELRPDGVGRVAFISQSGAYMISRMSKLPWLSPRYAVSTGNQADLTLSDFLVHLAKDPEVRTFAVYAEGFKDGDGLSFAKAVKEVSASGRDVLFYKAGRTTEGKTATSGHTASLAGDYDVCESVVREAGAVVARTFEEYLDLLKLSALMGDRPWAGRRLAALSNAGFEAVGMADSLRGDGWRLELAKLAPETMQVIRGSLARGKLDSLVDARNPLDITPMASDEVHEDAVRAFLADPGVDLVLCATIPLTPAMATLPDAVGKEALSWEGSLPNRLGRLLATAKKPLVGSIDSGPTYDPMARLIEAQGVPCFRSADTALKAMGLYLEGRLRRASSLGA